jgi:DNA-binding XRE family transcriptional regulator
MDIPLIVFDQIRAARAILRVDQKTVAAAIGVSVPTFIRLERRSGPYDGKLDTWTKIVRFFETRGIEFVNDSDGWGVLYRGHPNGRSASAEDLGRVIDRAEQGNPPPIPEPT